MTKILAYIKFIASAIIILSILVGIIFSFDSSEILPAAIAAVIFLAVAGLYSYYLIKTGTWNLKSKSYSVSVLLIAGLLIHFIASGVLMYYSQHVFASEKVSKNLLFTTAPFFIVCVAVGIYDFMQFYKSWKTNSTSIEQ